MISERIITRLKRYVENGIETDDFLYDVLTNSLFGAMGRASMENRILLYDICDYIYNEIPGDCWGSVDKVEAWKLKGGLNNKIKDREK